MSRKRRMLNRANNPLFTPDPDGRAWAIRLFQAYNATPASSEKSSVASRRIAESMVDIIENCFWITPQVGENHLLRLKPVQLKLLTRILEIESKGVPVLLYVLKARRMGLSTAIAAYNTLKTISGRNIRTKVLAHRSDSSQTIFDMYTTFYDNLPDEMRPAQGIGSRHGKKLVFANQKRMSDKKAGLNSEIEVLVPVEASGDGAGSIGRAMNSNILHISELAFWDNPKASLASLMQTFSSAPESACIVETTAQRSGDYAHNFWNACLSGDNDFEPMFFAWFEDPTYTTPFNTPELKDRFEKSLEQDDDGKWGNEVAIRDLYGLTLEQLNWRRYTISNKCDRDLTVFRREYPSNADEAFQSGHGNYINGETMHWYVSNAKPPMSQVMFTPVGSLGIPIPEPVKNGLVKIYDEPEPFAEYLCGVDVSENLPSGDMTVGVITRRVPEEVVAVIRGIPDKYIPTVDEIAFQLSYACLYFNQAKMCVEANSIGKELLYVLQNVVNYPYLLSENMLIPEMNRKEVTLTKWGLRTTSTIRRQFTLRIRELFENREIGCLDETILREAQALAKDRYGRVSAPKKGQQRNYGEQEEGFYDDTIFALAITNFCNARLPVPKSREEKEMEHRRKEVSRYSGNWRTTQQNQSRGIYDYV